MRSLTCLGLRKPLGSKAKHCKKVGSCAQLEPQGPQISRITGMPNGAPPAALESSFPITSHKHLDKPRSQGKLKKK